MADGNAPSTCSASAIVTGITRKTIRHERRDVLAAEFPAPTHRTRSRATQLFLNLTNVGMMIRPDLFDPHTVHFHGFPECIGGV